ncbi:extracellular solute-binding protein [Microlunatus sp. GCM10028923]|uniref:extracellular solute-binding protein n=1 Tax=Microlunatus sp. GCM10028923 TaxID=3273400 RepID=UPI00362088D5
MSDQGIPALRPGPLGRRRLLQAGLGASLAVAGAGCSAITGEGSGAPPAASGGTGEVPKHIPAPAVDGEIKSKLPGLPNAFAKVPDPLRASWPEKPGDGTSMSMFSIIWSPPPPPVGQNPFWTDLNDRLGLELKMVWGPSDAYESKLATLLAGGDLPDVTNLLPNPIGDKALKQGAFADLTDFLAGDKMQNYPNLAANTAEDAWRNTMINGRVMGVTNPVPAVDTAFIYRGDWAKKIGLSAPPANADEFREFLVAIPKAIPPQNGQTPYGIGAFPGSIMAFILAMFRVGPSWQVADGKVVSRIDTPEYEAAITWCRELWAAGGYHPDALALDAQEIKVLGMFNSSQIGIAKGGIGYAFAATSEGRQLIDKHPGTATLLPPGHDGGKPKWVKTSGWFSRWGISAKAAEKPGRVETILRCIDYLSACFGTKEYMANRFGIEGRHWNYNDKREPTPVDDPTLQAELTGLTQYPHAYYYPGTPTGYSDALAYAEALATDGYDDPLASLPSEVGDRLGGVLEKITDDYINQIVSGRRPMSDFEAFKTDWHKRGGDQIKADLEKQLAAR